MCVNRWFPIGTLFFFLARSQQVSRKDCLRYVGNHPKSSEVAAKKLMLVLSSGLELYRHAGALQLLRTIKLLKF